MSNLTTFAPALIDSLVTFCNTTFPASSPVEVFDGKGNTSNDTGQQLWIGITDPHNDGLDIAIAGNQSWHGTGGISGPTRDDNGDIPCVARAWGGDSNAKEVRDEVTAMLALLENAIRADPTWGGVPGLLWSEYGTDYTWLQQQDSNGATCECRFLIHYRGLI